MQARFKMKESLEWIVYDANGSPIAACRDSDTASSIKPDHGFVYHHDDPPPNVEATKPASKKKTTSKTGG